MKNFQKVHLQDSVDIVRNANGGELLIAGYGSLPNRPEPGLTPISPGWILNYRKEMCIRVTTCRGTSSQPARVAGLVPDTKSRSMCMIAKADGDQQMLLEQLENRELAGMAYDPRVVAVDLMNGKHILAVAFVAAFWHVDLLQEMVTEQANVIAKASGSCGSNREYLDLILDFEWKMFGMVTPKLAALQKRLERMAAGRATRSFMHRKHQVLFAVHETATFSCAKSIP
ncbi:MAG: gamma-glutamylcyclotransferase [Lentilitoribacter sp.]